MHLVALCVVAFLLSGVKPVSGRATDLSDCAAKGLDVYLRHDPTYLLCAVYECCVQSSYAMPRYLLLLTFM